MIVGQPSLAGINFAGPREEPPAGDVSTSDLFSAAWRSQRLTGEVFADRNSDAAAIDREIDSIFEATGQRLENPYSVKGLASQEQMKRGVSGSAWEFYRRRKKELAQQFPDAAGIIMPERESRAAAALEARRAERHLQELSERYGPWWQSLPVMLAGGVGASFQDPVNLLTLPLGIGPAAKGFQGLIWAATKSAALNVAVETAMQPAIQAWRAEAGLQSGFGTAATDIATAGLFGFAADAIPRATVRGFRAATGNPYEGPPAPDARLDQAARAAPEGSTLRAAADGDAAALAELAQASGAIDQPGVRGAVRALADAGVTEADLKALNRDMGIDDGEGLRRMAQALRAAVDPDEPPPRMPDAVPPERGPRLDDGGPAPQRSFDVEGKPVAFAQVRAADVIADPAQFQFKAGGDAAGATDRLMKVRQWDPIAAGRIVVYQRADGTRVIADGHQRLALAKRLSSVGQQRNTAVEQLASQDVSLDAYVFREVDGWSPDDVRALAAKKNLQEGSGTVVDTAQIMRARPDIIDGSIPFGSEKLRQARALSRLSDEAFGRVVAGQAPPHYAALIGDLVEDRARHASMLDELIAADPANAREARFVVGDLMQSEVHVETQLTLLGAQTMTRSLVRERAKALDATLKLLRDDQRVFGILQREAGRIEGVGNRLATDANAERAAQAATVQAVVEQLAVTRGPVSDWLTQAARTIAEGGSAKRAGEAVAERVRRALDSGGLRSLTEAPSLEPAGAGGVSRIDEPGGEAARLQTEELSAGLRRDLDDIRDPAAARERDESVQASLFALRQKTMVERQADDPEAWAAELLDEYFGDWNAAQRQMASMLEQLRRASKSDAMTTAIDRLLARLQKEPPLRAANTVSKNLDMTPEKLTLYHGSDWLFTSFDKDQAVKNTREGTPDGGELFFATPSEAAARHFGENVYKLEANVRLFDPESSDLDAIRPWVEAQENPHKIMQWLSAGASGQGQMNSWIAIEGTPGMIDELKRLGFDGARMSEWHGSTGNMPTVALWRRGKTTHFGSDQVMFAITDPAAYVHNPNIDMGAVRREVDRVVERLPRGVRAEVRDRLVFGEVGEIDGRFDPYDAAVYVSLAAADPARVARHEEVHALRALGLFADAEWRALTDHVGANGIRERYDIDGRYGEIYKKQFGDDAERYLVEEAVAEMIADYQRGTRFGATIDAVIRRIVKFLDDLRAALGGQRIARVDDIFDAIESGEIGRRGGVAQQRNTAVDQLASGNGLRSIFVFAGERAEGADLAARDNAAKMEAAGESRDKIWRETGWFRGADGKWRWEIDDSGARLGGGGNRRLQTFLRHDDFADAYPSLQGISVKRLPENAGGYYSPFEVIGVQSGSGTKSIALHEAQHAVQAAEGFSRGANPATAATLPPLSGEAAHIFYDAFELRGFAQDAGMSVREYVSKRQTMAVGSDPLPFTSLRTRREFSPEGLALALDDDAYAAALSDFARRDGPTAYRRTAGEVEARAVQARRDLTPDQRRARPPWLDYDVPEREQIVRIDGGEALAVDLAAAERRAKIGDVMEACPR